MKAAIEIIRMTGRIFLFILIGYSALCVLGFFFQRSLLYLPATTRLAPEHARTAGLRYWPSYADFRGFTRLDELPQAQGTVVVFHGNGGAAYQRGYYLDALSRHKLRVILAEYPGYGGRAGAPSESTLVADARQTVEAVYQMYGPPLYLWGESLGAGVAAAVVPASPVPIQGVVLFTPWDTLPDLAQTIYPVFPARWLVRDRYDSIQNLQGYAGPVAVILAGSDEVVPVRHGKRLYESLGGKKKLWVMPGAGHNTMPVSSGLTWWGEVVDFITR